METQNSSSDNGLVRLDAGLEFHKTIDFDKRQLRRALAKGAGRVTKQAKRLVSSAALSAAGQFPGRDMGTLRRHIGIVKRGSKGGYIKVGVRTIKGEVFYPAVLFYGSAKRNIARRGNYMTAALAQEAEPIRNEIRAALRNALVPR